MRQILALALLVFGTTAVADALPQSPLAGLSKPVVDCGQGVPAFPVAGQRGPFQPQCLPAPIRVRGEAMTPDPFRALVHQGDRVSVAAMLQEALDLDARPGADRNQARALFAVFQELHPAVDAFTANWLTDAPDDPFAQTARGWQLFRQGWAWRGGSPPRQTWPDRLAQMARLHLEAISLMRAAFDARPDLLPASDGILRLDQTVGIAAEVALVLETVMSTQPNRLSLMRGMLKFAPQWGGTQLQVDLLCDRYAPLVPGVLGYDAPTCAIDAAYYTEYRDGPRLDSARTALQTDTADVLDYARVKEVLRGFGTPADRKAVLTKVKAGRDLTVEEAMAWDGLIAEERSADHLDELPNPKEVAERLKHIQDHERDLTAEERALFDKAIAQITGGGGLLPDPAEERLARERLVETARIAAGNAPLSPEALGRYRTALLDQASGLAGMPPIPYPAFDIESRLAQVLAAFPDDLETWVALGEDVERFGTRALPPEDRVARFTAAEPYFDNAIAFGMAQPWVLGRAVSGKIYALIEHGEMIHLAEPPELSPEVLARQDAELICPALRQIVLLAASCEAEGRPWTGCGPWPLHMQDPIVYLQSKIPACPLLTDPAGMAYSPVPVDLSAFN